MNSWRESTKKLYDQSIRKWISYCEGNSIDPDEPETRDILNFISCLFDQNCSYDQMKNARSAFSSMIRPLENKTFGQIPIVKRFMKGVFELRPTFPRISVVWDVNILFDYFRSLLEPSKLSLN